jgi:hypothetical protein
MDLLKYRHLTSPVLYTAGEGRKGEEMPASVGDTR